MRSLLIVTSLLAGLGASPALACKVAPPLSPGEAARAALEEQTGETGRSPTIFLAEIAEVGPSPVPGSPVEGRRVVMRPLYALRGALPRGPLDWRQNAWTSCGLSPNWAAMWGTRGQRFVVFSIAARPGPDDVIDTVPEADLVQPELRARLDRRRAPDRP